MSPTIAPDISIIVLSAVVVPWTTSARLAPPGPGVLGPSLTPPRLVRPPPPRHAVTGVRRPRRRTPTRHAVDAIARAVARGRRGGRRHIDALADAVAARMWNRLEAVGAPGGSRHRPTTKVDVDPALLRLVLERTTRHLLAWGRRAERARQA